MTGGKTTDFKQRLPAAARRRQLLDTALDRFASGGYHATSMEEIADAAGVTKPVLYQHFQSKQHLFLELLETVGMDLLSAVGSRAEAEVDPYQRLRAGLRAYFEFVSERTSAFQLVFASEARSSDEFADSVRRLEDGLAATIGRFIDASIDDDHRELIGYAVVGASEVAARRWVATATPRRHPEREAEAGLDQAEAELRAARLAELVWAGLRGLPGGGP